MEIETNIYTRVMLIKNACDVSKYPVPLFLIVASHQLQLFFFFFYTFTPEFCLLKDKVKRFQEKEDLRNLLLEAAEYSVSGSGSRSCYWGQHGSLLASWGLLPYTPSFAVKDPCLTLLISMLEDIILNLIVLSSPLSLLWQALPS